MLGILVVIAQVVATPLQPATDERPVRLWLGASPVAPGSEMPVYVAAENDGYLLVLRVATDGRVSVVFPADPKSAGRVTRGSYELREARGRPALILNEGRGTGLVFAALSETPFRFGEFSRSGRWDSALLVASHPGADGPGTLTDIAQRMLGDGWFNSAFALYTVRAAAPQTAARQEPRALARGQNTQDVPQEGAACNGCTIVYQTVLPTPVIEQTVIERTFVEPVWILANSCDVRLGNCGSRRFDRRNRLPDFPEERGLPELKTEGVCSIGIDCPRSVVPKGMAVRMRSASLRMSPVPRPAPPAPQLPPGEFTVPVPVRASMGVGSRMAVLAKAAPVSAGAPVSRGAVVRRTSRPAGVAAPQARATPVVQRAGGAMTARQSGTALRAARILPRR